MKIVWSPLALKRVQEIAAYIAMDKPSAAEDWIRGLFKAVAKLGRYPEIGTLSPGETQSQIQKQTQRELADPVPTAATRQLLDEAGFVTGNSSGKRTEAF